MPIGGISVSAMYSNICSLRTKPGDRALVFGPSVYQASHGLGTTDREEGVVQVAQAVLASTAARTLALGTALNNCYPKGIVTSIEIEMGRHVRGCDNQSQIIRPREAVLIRFIDFF